MFVGALTAILFWLFRRKTELNTVLNRFAATDVTTATQEKIRVGLVKSVILENGGIIGGAEEGRTPDLRIAKRTLSNSITTFLRHTKASLT